MKTIGLIIAMALLAGCQKGGEPPLDFVADLRVQVLAQPKVGANMANMHVSVFDEPGNRNADKRNLMQKVDYDSLEDIVVWLEPVQTNRPMPMLVSPRQIDVNPQSAAARLAACTFIRYPIYIRNAGPAPANLYSLSDGNEFDAGVIQPGESALFNPQAAGLVEVFTDSLAQPVARIYVAPTQWNHLTQAGQIVDFPNISPGKWKIVSWHPRLPGHEVLVDLAGGQTVKAAINVSVNGLPQVSAR
jgi:hypothetical protein